MTVLLTELPTLDAQGSMGSVGTKVNSIAIILTTFYAINQPTRIKTTIYKNCLANLDHFGSCFCMVLCWCCFPFNNLSLLHVQAKCWYSSSWLVNCLPIKDFISLIVFRLRYKVIWWISCNCIEFSEIVFFLHNRSIICFKCIVKANGRLFALSSCICILQMKTIIHHDLASRT